MYRYEPSSLSPLAYRVVDTRYAVGDPQHIVTDNVTNMMAARLLVILTHPAFRVLTQRPDGTYRLEMTHPDEEVWEASGTVRWIIESSYELPLEG